MTTCGEDWRRVCVSAPVAMLDPRAAGAAGVATAAAEQQLSRPDWVDDRFMELALEKVSSSSNTRTLHV